MRGLSRGKKENYPFFRSAMQHGIPRAQRGRINVKSL
jgi:hypothetical protein